MEELEQWIKQSCLASTTTDPLELLIRLMKTDGVRIHGPEHHILDGACFLAALRNAGMDFDLGKALDQMIERGRMMPGAICGHWGVCGSAASLGAALSILHGTGPLNGDRYYSDHLRYTALVLNAMAGVGGPRCCKRNAFLAIRTAVDFVEETYGIRLPKQKPVCGFSPRNQQCLGAACPFFGGRDEENV